MSRDFHAILEVVDLLYIAVVLTICQFTILPEILKMFLSLPYFVLVPYLTGRFFFSLIESRFTGARANTVGRIIGNWSLGIIIVFSLGLFLQVTGVFDVYLYALITMVLLGLAKLESIRARKSAGSVFQKFKGNFDVRILVLLLIVGLIPPILQSQLWPFPLKYESDGFNIVMQTKEAIQQNLVDIYSIIHLPIESSVLCIPCVLFNLEPSHYLWGLPFLIYPVFILAIYLLAIEVTNNAMLSVVASVFGIFFFGGGTNVFNLFMILPRNLLSLLFVFSLYLVFSRGNSTDEGHGISLRVKDAFLALLVSVLLYSTIAFVISPTFNHLHPAFLLIALAVPAFVIGISYRNVKIARVVTVALCSILAVAFSAVFLFDINFPSVYSLAFLTTLGGICSSIGLILFATRKGILYGVNFPFLAIVALTMLLYHQLGVVQNLLLSLIVMFYYAMRRHSFVNFGVKVATSAMILTLSIFSLGIFKPFFDMGGSVGYYASILEGVFTNPLMIMFFIGCVLVVLGKNMKQHLMAFSVGTILILYIVAASFGIGATTRFLELVPFFIAFFAAIVLQPFQKLLDQNRDLADNSRLLQFFRANIRGIRRSWIFSLVLITFLIPSLVQPYSSFLNSCNLQGVPPYTFSDYEYKTGIWLDDHVPKNALVLSDPFTTLILTSLSGNRLTLTYRMTYDAKGNTHSIYYDSDVLGRIRAFFLTTNISDAEILLDGIWHRYDDAFVLNKGIIDAKENVGSEIVLAISGRTSKWLTASTLSDVPFPQSFIWLSGYQKFLQSSSFTLLYEMSNEIYVFKWSGGQES